MSDTKDEGIFYVIFYIIFVLPLMVIVFQPLAHFYLLISYYIENNLTNMMFFVYIMPFFILVLLPYLVIFSFIKLENRGIIEANILALYMIGFLIFLFNLDYYFTGDTFIFKIISWIINFLF